LALGCASAIAQPLTFDGGTVGGAASNARAELFAPMGAGPFPALVVLHGCNGVGRHERLWAQQLTAWGYVAIVVDSLRPRDMSTVCNQGMLVPPELQALDGFNAANYLRAQPNVAGERVGVIGFSHGGWGGVEGGACRSGEPSLGETVPGGCCLLPGMRPAAFAARDRHLDPDRRSR
jgi:hypothetical protein